MNAWHIMLTVPHGEATAASGLIGRDFEAKAPQIWRRVRHGRGKVIDRAYSMFPGYIFVRCSSADYLRVRAIPRIRDFLRSEGAPVKISAAAVQAILDKEQELEKRRIARLKAKIKHDYLPGQDIEIVEGPFAPMLTRIEALDDKGRIIVLINMLGRAVRTELDAPQIRAA